MSAASPPIVKDYALPHGFRLLRALSVLRTGARDPTAKRLRDGWAFGLRIDGTPATLVLQQAPAGDSTREAGPTARCARVHAYGPGAEAAHRVVPDLLGAADTTRSGAEAMLAECAHPILHSIGQAHRTTFFIRRHDVMAPLLPIVLGQRVTGTEQVASYSALSHMVSEAAPGPIAGLVLPPDPRRVARLTMDEWFSLGVLRAQAVTMIELCRRARSIEAKGLASDAALIDYLLKFPGVGPWTTGSLFWEARADADHLPIGDYHLKNQVVHAFTGRARGDDAEMMSLLDPFAPHRGRVVRWLAASGKLKAPRFGPKAPLRQSPMATKRGRL